MAAALYEGRRRFYILEGLPEHEARLKAWSTMYREWDLELGQEIPFRAPTELRF